MDETQYLCPVRARVFVRFQTLVLEKKLEVCVICYKKKTSREEEREGEREQGQSE